MVIRKFNYYRFFVFIVVLISLIIGIFILIKRNNYKKTYDYKLNTIGYNEDEINTIKEKLDNDKINELLNRKYDSTLVDFLKERYFIYKNLDKYLEYKKKNRTNEEITLEEIIAKVNIHRDKYFYENTFKTDTSKGNLILVNKYYYLDKTFLPKGVKNADLNYSYDGIKVATESYNAFIKMFNAAKSDGIKLILNS